MDNFLSLVLSIVSLLVAIFVGTISLFEIKQSRQSHLDNRRPYIVPTWEVRIVGSTEKLYLVLVNYGLSVARDVVVNFPADQAWHNVKPVDFPFLAKKGGISVMPPGSNLSYFVGRITPQSGLEKWKTDQITVEIMYKHVHGKSFTYSDEFGLTLRDYKYAKSSV